MTRFILIMCFIYFIILFVTFAFHTMFKKKKFVKYVPAVFSLILGIYNVYIAVSAPAEGFQDIAGAIFAIIFFVGFIAGAGAALFLDYVWPKFKKS